MLPSDGPVTANDLRRFFLPPRWFLRLRMLDEGVCVCWFDGPGVGGAAFEFVGAGVEADADAEARDWPGVAGVREDMVAVVMIEGD